MPPPPTKKNIYFNYQIPVVHIVANRCGTGTIVHTVKANLASWHLCEIFVVVFQSAAVLKFFLSNFSAILAQFSPLLCTSPLPPLDPVNQIQGGTMSTRLHNSVPDP